MVSNPSSSGEHQPNGRGGSGGNVRVERTPGTPRKDREEKKEKAIQDPGLKDYVYRALARRFMFADMSNSAWVRS